MDGPCFDQRSFCPLSPCQEACRNLYKYRAFQSPNEPALPLSGLLFFHLLGQIRIFSFENLLSKAKVQSFSFCWDKWETYLVSNCFMRAQFSCTMLSNRKLDLFGSPKYRQHLFFCELPGFFFLFFTLALSNANPWNSVFFSSISTNSATEYLTCCSTVHQFSGNHIPAIKNCIAKQQHKL